MASEKPAQHSDEQRDKLRVAELIQFYITITYGDLVIADVPFASSVFCFMLSSDSSCDCVCSVLDLVRSASVIIHAFGGPAVLSQTVGALDRGFDGFPADRWRIAAGTSGDASIESAAVEARLLSAVAANLLAFETQADLYYSHNRQRDGNGTNRCRQIAV